MKSERAPDEEVVAVVETDMCGVDAIQYLTGCTFGKGNLIHLDYGKNAFTFYRRSDGRGMRVVTRPELFDEADDDMMSLMRRKMAGEVLSDKEENQLTESRAARTRRIMEADLKELFIVKPVEKPVPKKARVLASLTCEKCGEKTMETRTRRINGQTLCIPCFEVEEKRD